MAEQRSESFVNELEGETESLTDEEFARLERFMKSRSRAVAPATAAPTGAAPAQPTSTGRFVPSTRPKLRGRDVSGNFLKRFRTSACLNRCDSPLDSEISVNTYGTPRVELERLHDNNLVENSLKVWHGNM